MHPLPCILPDIEAHIEACFCIEKQACRCKLILFQHRCCSAATTSAPAAAVCGARWFVIPAWCTPQVHQAPAAPADLPGNNTAQGQHDPGGGAKEGEGGTAGHDMGR